MRFFHPLTALINASIVACRHDGLVAMATYRGALLTPVEQFRPLAVHGVHEEKACSRDQH